MEDPFAMADGGCAVSVARGKRTKRQRVQMPLPELISWVEPAVSSTTSSQLSAATTTTMEEVDMANCLILLAQGPVPTPEPDVVVDGVKTVEKGVLRRFTETASAEKAAFCVYQCKTCNKRFPSFQALGGHRAGHKKPKMSITSPTPAAVEYKATVAYEDCNQLNGSGKPRIHDCLICRAEFASGQALGGHMRRHRPSSYREPPPPEAKKEASGLSLDLNLPAPSGDDQPSASNHPPNSSTAIPPFSFASKAAPLLLSAAALVGCHY